MKLRIVLLVVTVIFLTTFLERSGCVAQEFSVETLDGKIRVLLDGETFTELVHGSEAGFGELPRPFLYPIVGPTGAAMTRNFPMDKSFEEEEKDHPHHRSLWFAHPVNETDFWSETKGAGRIIPTGEFQSVVDENGCQIVMESEWVTTDGVKVIDSVQMYRFGLLEDNSRVIDVRIEMTPGNDIEQATFMDTKEGSMALRSHPALRLVGEHANGQAINSEGNRDRELWGKRAKWVAYWGEIEGEECGFAILDHPDNLRHPTWWHARHYGLVGANPFGIHDFERKRKGIGNFTLEKGDTLTLNYRFIFFSGSAEDAKLEKKFDDWSSE